MSESLISIESSTPQNTENSSDQDDFLFADSAETPVEAARAGEREVGSRIGHEFAGEMEKQGIHATVLEGEHNPLPDILKSLTLVDHETLPDEPTVRLYRGVNPTDGRELVHQVGYLLKRPSYDGFGRPPEVELESSEVFQLVEAFAENPSYRGLIDAVHAAQMSDSDRRFVDDRIKDIRRSLVQHSQRSFLDELAFQHVAAPGGSPTQDLSPFVATSTRPEYAAGWGSTVMVLDVPLSRVAGLGEGKNRGDEVLLTGVVNPAWVTAVAELKTRPETPAGLRPLEQILGATEPTDFTIFENTVLHQKSKDNYQDDLKEVNVDLIDELLTTPDIDIQALKDLFETEGISNYRDALWAAADYYLKQLQSKGRYRHVVDIQELYKYDELNQYDYVHDTPYFEWDDAQRKIEEAGVLNLQEIERLAKINSNLSMRNG